MQISKDEIIQWKQMLITKEYFNALKQQQAAIKEVMALGQTLTENAERDTARSVGRIEGLEDALTIIFIDDEGE